MTTDTQSNKSYKDSLNLPRTDFAMEAKLVQNEPPRLARWKQGRLYEQTLAARASGEKWVLHDGPPFANGDIHIGHLVNKTLKDIIIRFRCMEGHQTPYVPGWDCHGLPIEHKIQEQIKKEGKNIREMSVLDVRRRCMEYADKYAAIQSEQFQRLGILGQWDQPYLTMRPRYEAQTLEVFARIVEAGLVYRRLKPVPWSIANQTALADAELEYQDVTDASVYVEFPLNQPIAGLPAYLLVWTTTPWTLPANLAVAANATVDYSLVRYARGGADRVALIATDLRERVFAKANIAYSVVSSGTYADLLGQNLAYTHPFIDRVGRVVGADYVTTTDGTGLVHTAPGHGEDDYETGLREGLDVYSPVLFNGQFDDTVPSWLRGKNVFKANPEIVAHLKERGVLFAEEPILHSYPHDWRSKTPIIFRATEQWFVAMDQAGIDGASPLRAAARHAVEQVRFIPEWGRARIEGMLQSRPDWCISRQRAWGLPIPVFYNEQGKPLLTPQSVRAVARRFEQHGSDAWFTQSPGELLGPDFIYPPGFSAENLRKEKDIFDVWFESGSSWQAVLRSGMWELKYPADLYLEGSDQHRGWFQLSLLPSLGAMGAPPFKQVLTHGFIVKPDGKKVSKSDKEYVTATDEINRHGADLLRLWVSSIDYQNDIPTSPRAIGEFGDKYRKIRNTLRYLLSNLYDFDPAISAVAIPHSSLDGWILDQLQTLIADVKSAMNDYQLHRAFRLLHDFCAVQISAVYGNAMKDRLYCEAPDSPLRRRSQATMHQVVIALAKLLAPILVFTADETWEHIGHKPAGDESLSSVHLALYPEPAPLDASPAQREQWKMLMALRDQATLQLDGLKKSVGLNKATDAEIVYEVRDEATRRALQAWGVDLEDLVGAGYHSFAAATTDAAVAVKMLDRRADYPLCARSRKRRPDVGQDAEYPDLCPRDAAAVRAARGNAP